LAEFGGAHRVFHQVVVEAGLPVLDVPFEAGPLAEQIAGGLPDAGLGAVART
jgi:hypothetical protein